MGCGPGDLVRMIASHDDVDVNELAAGIKYVDGKAPQKSALK
jgi:hypothetical protein